MNESGVDWMRSDLGGKGGRGGVKKGGEGESAAHGLTSIARLRPIWITPALLAL